MVEPDEHTRLADLGENEVVSRLTRKLSYGEEVVVGPGDDCAVLNGDGSSYDLLKTDCIIEGVHFEADTDPILVGQKAVNRALSDIGAMGGIPKFAVITIACDGDREVQLLEKSYDGMFRAADAFGCRIVGGETSRTQQRAFFLNVAMTGEVEKEKCIRRSGAVAGDIIAVTGSLGGSLKSGRHLTFTPRIAEARWLVQNFRPTAMMDLSDGLGSDLPRLCKASGVGCEIDRNSIPCNNNCTISEAISDGEDYELLLTFRAEAFDEGREKWELAFPELPLTRIGTINNENIAELENAWEHFSEK